MERREERLCHFALPSSTFVGRCSRKLPQCSTTSNIETAMLIVQCASAQCDLCIGTQLCIERSDTAVAGTVRRSAHSSVTVDPGGSAAGTSHHQHHPLSSTIMILQLFLTASRESHNVVHDCSKRVQHAFCSYLPHLIYTTLCYIKPAC